MALTRVAGPGSRPRRRPHPPHHRICERLQPRHPGRSSPPGRRPLSAPLARPWITNADRGATPADLSPDKGALPCDPRAARRLIPEFWNGWPGAGPVPATDPPRAARTASRPHATIPSAPNSPPRTPLPPSSRRARQGWMRGKSACRSPAAAWLTCRSAAHPPAAAHGPSHAPSHGLSHGALHAPLPPPTRPRLLPGCPLPPRLARGGAAARARPGALFPWPSAPPSISTVVAGAERRARGSLRPVYFSVAGQRPFFKGSCTGRCALVARLAGTSKPPQTIPVGPLVATVPLRARARLEPR
ncbi:hypothetical protein SAMN05216499_1617 [Actinacidiphila paucisporea]|uniref:Uncharacterized protein n=1 Tax=Actinacidiphila paucisporea TaxID=310782 RepID=A0A1M7R0C7_9ACTN|nr:hypothetical protein SAMN05216499_1617 [Actinacidiphila paucisporea]